MQTLALDHMDDQFMTSLFRAVERTLPLLLR